MSNAIWAKEKIGERWVDAVLCVAEDVPPAPQRLRHGSSAVCLMGVPQLRPWLESRR